MYELRHNDESFKILLRNTIQQEYELNIRQIVPAKRGYHGETWILYANNTKYFMKIDYSPFHQKIYAENLNIILFLQTRGIDFVGKVIKNKKNENFIRFYGGVLAIFDYINGDHCRDYDKTTLFKSLAQIYSIPHSNIKIEQEDFSIDCAYYVLENMNCLDGLIDYKMISQYANRLVELSEFCKSNLNGLFITHGDCGGNIIKCGEKLYIVDWDNPKLAAPERDIWLLVCDYSDILMFNTILSNMGINYSIQKSRLAFYSYYNYFYYLKEHLVQYKSTDDVMMLRRIRGFVRRFFPRGWINQQINIIEGIYNEL